MDQLLPRINYFALLSLYRFGRRATSTNLKNVNKQQQNVNKRQRQNVKQHQRRRGGRRRRFRPKPKV